MKVRLALVLAAGVAVAACSSQSDDPAASVKATAKMPASAAAALGVATKDAATRGRFANLPDRGTLVRYPDQRVVREDGAYTWHRADLSESHALSAIGGVLAVTTPSGELLRFRYERHVEHPNGDWTWVGSLGNGSLQEAVITFGAKAAFGSIGQPGEEALRLTMRNGVSWLVETDLAEIAKLDHVGTRPTEPDFMIAPEVVAAARPRAPASAAVTVDAPAAARVGAASATATASTTVDLVLGYTAGFASAWGGDSQAQTRLNNMVEITNETYANSQIDARVRLVRSVAVSYSDTTTNEDALEELTGYRDGTTFTPNAAFNALRAARDQYGGDLVSLVRKFSSGNEGCGIAWLIGGGRRGSISASSERFGYSVVGDGDYTADGKTYFCRQETLAHELGHNMGAAHDRDTSDGDDNVLQDSEYGVYDYSFGYKTGPGAGNFFTVMAYGDSGQVRNRIFSNPRISKCGAESNTHPRGLGPSTPTGTLACGTSTADNARTLSQTMPAVAAFRSTVVVDELPRIPVLQSADLNGDGRTDLLFENTQQGRFEYRLMAGSSVLQSVVLDITPGYWIGAVGDFDQDGRSDLVWTSAGRELWMWRPRADGSFQIDYAGRYDAGWALIGAGDFTGDLRPELLLHNRALGIVSYWSMQGPVQTASRTFEVTPGYWVAAIADFSSSPGHELLWTSTNRDLWHWNFANGTPSAAYGGSYVSGWRVAGARDFNGDGRADLFLHNSMTARAAYSLRNGTSTTLYYEFDITPGYALTAVGDFNGDGRADVAWSSSDIWLWFGSGSWFSAAYGGTVPAGSRLAGN